MQHFYPYFDVVETDWLAQLEIALRSAAQDADEEAFYPTFQRLGAALCDGHCWTGGPGRPIEMHPALFLTWAEEKLCVAHSKVSGISLGDALIEIDGIPVDQAVKQCLALWSVPSPQGAELKSALNVLAGPPQSEVHLVVEPYNAPGTRKEVKTKRDLGSPFSLVPKRERKKELASGVLYLDLDQWTQEELDAEWAALGKARGLVFEFRNYPMKIEPFKFFGCFSDKPVTSAKFLTPSITRPDHSGMVYPDNGGWRIPAQASRLSNPCAFLIDANSISYAESCMSIVEHHRLAEIVGTPTMGTNGNMVHAKLPCGFVMSFTAMKVLKQDGTPHHGIGIRPTVQAKPTQKGLAEGRDEVIEKALEVLLSK
jgi:C-terminal processing protease CtpA/Prc